MQQTTMAARTLRELARRLEAGEYDRVDISQMCPMQSVTGPDGFRLSAPLPVLVVSIVAWRSYAEVMDAKEKDGNSSNVPLQPDGHLRATG